MANQSKPTQAASRKTRSSVNRSKCWRALISILIFALLISSCTVSVTGEYWIPPSSSATPLPQVSMLGGVSATQAGIDPPSPTADFATETAEVSSPTPAEPSPTEPPLPTETPTPDIGFAPTQLPSSNSDQYLYYVQAADTLPAVAVRFGVKPEEITSPDPIPPTAVLTPGQLLIIPRRLANVTSSQRLLPDSELVYSPSATDFDVTAFAKQAGGRLITNQEWLKSTGVTSGPEVVQKVALENSINPRLLLALLEYQSDWVYGQPATQDLLDFPMGVIDQSQKGLYAQLVWTVNKLSIGYYSWREGRLTELKFSDGVTARLAPDLNAGSAALQYYFAQLYDSQAWLKAMDLQSGFPALYVKMFGNPWERAKAVEPLYPPGLTQPPMTLPFKMGDKWAFTGGPHGAWEHDGSYAALDFAPPSIASGCIKSNVWVVASASGLVVRSDYGIVVLDLDGDGKEQTGWVLTYLHVSTEKRIPAGSWVEVGTPLGHPSCEGGLATGTHVHIARKYNGEWIAAGGPMPFNLSGWIATAGAQAYQGTLVRDGQVVEACTCSSGKSMISRGPDDP